MGIIGKSTTKFLMTKEENHKKEKKKEKTNEKRKECFKD